MLERVKEPTARTGTPSSDRGPRATSCAPSSSSDFAPRPRCHSGRTTRFHAANGSTAAVSLEGCEQASPNSRPNCTSPRPTPIHSRSNPLYHTGLRLLDMIQQAGAWRPWSLSATASRQCPIGCAQVPLDQRGERHKKKRRGWPDTRPSHCPRDRGGHPCPDRPFPIRPPSADAGRPTRNRPRRPANSLRPQDNRLAQAGTRFLASREAAHVV